MYVKFIAQYALEFGMPFQIQTTTEAKALSEWKVHGLDAYPNGLSKSLGELIQKISNEDACNTHLIVPDADRWLIELLRQRKPLGKTHISLLIMRPRAGKSVSSKLNHLVKLALLATIRVSFNQVTIFALTSDGMSLSKPYSALGINPLFDPVEWNPTMDRSELGLSPDQIGKTLFLVAGELSERKYISEIVNAWDFVKPQDALLVLVGRISPTLEVELSDLISQSSSILNIDYYVSNETFDSWIDVADYVFILHRNAGSSGVALKASLSSKATVICGGLKSNVRSIQSLGSRCTELETVSQNSIVNFFHNFDRQLNNEGSRLNPGDTKKWAKKLTNYPSEM